MIWFLWRWAWFADVELDPTFFTSLRQLSACLCNSYASSVFVQAGRPWPGQGQVVQSLCSVWAFSLQPDNLNLNRLTLRSISYIIDHYCIYASSVQATLQFRLCREGFLFVCLFVCLVLLCGFVHSLVCLLPSRLCIMVSVTLWSYDVDEDQILCVFGAFINGSALMWHLWVPWAVCRGTRVK